MQSLLSADGSAAPGAALISDGSTATFMAEVVDASHDVPIIVDFWAPWCGPCKTLGPILEKLVREAKGAVRLVKIDVDKNQELAMQLQVSSIPAVYAFKDGRPVDRFVGALPESQIKAWVRKLMGSGGVAAALAEALEQARAALDAGDLPLAGNIFSQILQHEPTNPSALAGMGRLFIAKGDRAKAKEILAQVPEESATHAEVAGLRTLLELTEGQGAIRPASELEAALAANPKDHAARFDLAMAKFSAGDREGSMDELLELIRRDRAWNEEAARKQLLKMFEAFGATDPLVASARRRLSSILFS
jgi:putative thioredoxin